METRGRIATDPEPLERRSTIKLTPETETTARELERIRASLQRLHSELDAAAKRRRVPPSEEALQLERSGDSPGADADHARRG